MRNSESGKRIEELKSSFPNPDFPIPNSFEDKLMVGDGR
jgi:hypothetical protein